MTRKSNKTLLSLILSTVLIVAMAFSMTACSDNNTDNSQAGTVVDVNTEEVSYVTVLGEGETVFNFIVVDKEGNETAFEIHTDKTMVGDALLEHSLIEGEDAAYGLYVKTVNGITADYDVDGTYWAFYVNGEMAMSGVDATDVTEGAIYTFKVE